jgi:thioredoxin 1
MKSPAKIAITLLVVAAAATAFVLKEMKSRDPVTGSASLAPVAAAKLPKLLDLGAGKCIPCKAMVPVLEELEKEYAGRMIVEFIDVWKNEGAGKQYGVDIIPTQIFYDATGKELFRHTGFFGKEDILAKWKELGVNL